MVVVLHVSCLLWYSHGRGELASCWNVRRKLGRVGRVFGEIFRYNLEMIAGRPVVVVVIPRGCSAEQSVRGMS